MKTLKLTKAWILLCSLTAVSSATTEHASSHRNVTQHGGNTPQKTHPSSIVPFGIQIPEHVLSTQDVACISADNNIFQIMNEAKKTCNGTDMRCTFYHFVNHGYQNIGTLDINKELFDDLLMKFDNWLLTAENIDKAHVHGKVNADGSLDTANIKVNDVYTSEGKVDHLFDNIEANGVHTIQGNLDHNASESDNDRVHNHHFKNHNHKSKNEHHVKLDTNYKNGHRYFEVFLPQDRKTGKSKTIYVEIDIDKNEFVLVDEDIDKKLNGIKPIKIELDELSEIADSAFSNLVKSLKHKGHIHNYLNVDDKVITSDLNTNSAVENNEIHLDVDGHAQNILNSVCNPNICNINANQQLIPNNTTGIVKKILNVDKNLIVPNKYINQEQFHVESHIDNTTEDILNNHFEIPQNVNDTDIHQTVIYEKEPFDTIEFDHSNITYLDVDSEHNASLDFIEIPDGNEYYNYTEIHDFSTDHEYVTYDDNDFIQLVENNATSNNIDLDYAHDLTSFKTIGINKPILQDIKPDQEKKLKSTPYEPKLTSSDFTDSQLHLIPYENQQVQTDRHNDHVSCLVSTKPIAPFSENPVLGKDLSKVVRIDSHLQSSAPVYATLDLPSSDSQNPLLNTDFDHSTFTSLNSPLDVLTHQNPGPNIPQYASPIFPLPPNGCAVGQNKCSQQSPLNSGLIWLSPYLGNEDLQTPYATKPSLHSVYLPQDCILPLSQPSKVFSGTPKSISPALTIPIENPNLLQSAPSLSANVHEPYLTTTPLLLESNPPVTLKHTIMPSKENLPKSFADFDRMLTTSQLSEAPVSVTPYGLKGEVNLGPTDNLGLVKYSPSDNNLVETMIPCSASNNRYPCNKIPYYSNPYLKSPQYIPPYFEQPLSATALRPIAPLDYPSISLDQSNPCLNADYPRKTKPIPLPHLPFASKTQFSPSTPPWLAPGCFPNSCPNIWKNIPYQNMPSLSYSVSPAQNIWNYTPTPNNYLAPTIDLQQNQFYKAIPTNEVAKSVLEQPCANKNNLQKKALSYTPFSPIYTGSVQMELNPSLDLERDLQALSCKYGIPLAKILDSLDAEISGAHSQTLTLSELPCSNFLHDCSIKGKSQSSAKNAVTNEENISFNEDLIESDLTNLTPLDSTLIGPHLEMDNSLLIGQNDFETYTHASEASGTYNTKHLNMNNKPKNKFQDSSPIGPQLTTQSTSNFQLGDKDWIGNVELHQETDFSNLMPSDSSLIGPHLKIGSPPMVLDSNINENDILTPYIEVPVTSSSSQIKTKLNKNHLTNSLLDSSLIGRHLPTLYPAKQLLSEEIQSINEMIPLDPYLTELTHLDSSQVDFVNELEQAEILKHGKTTTTIDSTNLYKAVETQPNLIGGQLLLKSDPSKLIPLESTLIGPHLQTGSLSNITNTVSLKSEESIQNTDINVDELENIILPSSMLPMLLNKTVKSDLNLNMHTQDARLNEELNELSFDTNVELPITDVSTITQLLKETDFQILEPTLETTDSTKLKHKLISLEMPSNLDSSIQLDSTLIGPSLRQETYSREVLPMLDSVHHFETSKGVPTSDQNKKPFKNSAVIDSIVQLDSSLSTSLNLLEEINSQDTSTTLDSVNHLDHSFAIPNLHKTIDSSATSSFLAANSQLNSSLKGLSLKPVMETMDVSRAFDSKTILDTSLEGPHLLTAPFSSDEIKMINEELQLKSGLAHLKPLDSSLIGPHLDFDDQLDDLEISRYQNLESSGFVEEHFPLKYISMPSDLQELLSKFTNAITKSHLSASEIKPCDKLLSSLPKISSDNKNIQPCEDLPTYNFINTADKLASEFPPITPTVPELRLSPVEYITKEQPNITSNYFPTAITYPEYAYAKGVPQTHLKPLRPVVGNVPLSFGSNALALLPSQDLKKLLDLTSQSKICPQYPNMYTTGEIMASPSEWTTPLNILPEDNFILPSNLEYNPNVVDDIISVIDEEKHHLVKDMSFLPSLAPNVPTFRGEIVSPSLLDTIKFQPGLPIPMTNSAVPSSLYTYPQINNPQNIPFMKQTSYIPPYNSQPYSYLPLEGQWSEMVEPPPKLMPVTTESPNTFIESQLHEILNKPQFKESFTNPILDIEYLQQLLSKPCLDSPIVLPSSVLDTMLQLPTASNELNSIPCQSPPVYFIPISPIPTTPLSNEFTSYARPVSVSFAKPISTPSTNLPYATSPFAPPKLSINPYTLIPEFSSPLMPVKTEPSDYSYLPTDNRPIPASTVPYKLSQTYFSPDLPVRPSPLPIDISPYSPNLMGEFSPALTSSKSPVLSPSTLSAPYFRPVSKSLTNVGLPAYSDQLEPVSPSPMAPRQPGLLSPSYVCPDTYTYSPLPASTNPLKRPSSFLSPAYLTPIPQENSNLPSYIRCLPSNQISSPNPQTTKQELQLMKPMNAHNNPFSNAYQILPISPNIPIPNYPKYVPKSSPYPNSQIKQNIPCEDIIQSNLQTSPLIEEVPAYDVIEDNICIYSNDIDKFYQEPSLKYPLESMSYTLDPEQMTETLSDEDFVEIDHNSIATEPSPTAKLFQRPRLTPYTPLYGKPCPAQQYLPAPSSTEPIQQNIFDYIPPVPSPKPLKYPVSLSTSILSSHFLKPPTPVTFPSNPPILYSPYKDPSVNPYNVKPVNKEPLFSLPYYSEYGQKMLSLDPRVLRNITSPVFLQIPGKVPAMPVSPVNLPKAQPPYILDNFVELPPTYYEPKSKTRQNSLVKSSSMPSTPILSHIEDLTTPQYITPLSPPQYLKWSRPLFSPQYTSSILPATSTLQKSLSLKDAPIYYQPYNPPAELSNATKNIFKSPSVNSPYTVLPSFNNIVEPLSADLNKLQWSSFTPQYTSPASSSSPIPISSLSVPLSTLLPMTTPQTAKPAFSNHIIPSSLFMSSDIDLQIPTSKLSPLKNIPRHSLPFPSFIKPLETVPFETPSRPLGKTVLSQNILKPNKQFSSDKFIVPLSSSYLTPPLQPIDSYPAQPSPNIQYAKKPHPKLSPVSNQYATSFSSPSYTSLPLEMVPNRIINKPSIPQLSLSSAPASDSPRYSSSSAKNPYMNPYFESVPEVPSYPVLENLISSSKITPSNSILLSNLRPPDISQESLNSYLSPLTPSVPLSLPQKSSQYQPQMIPNYSQYLSHIPIESVSELLPSTSPFLKSPLLKPLLSNSQNNVPLYPMHFSSLNTANPERSPVKVLPSVTSSNEYTGQFTPLVSEIPATAEPIQLLPSTPYNLLNSRLNKYYQSPVSMANMPLFSNFDSVKSSPKLPIKANRVSTVKPIEVSAFTASESSPLSQNPLDTETIEEIEPYELVNMKETFSPTDKPFPLPTYLSQQRKFEPDFSKYLTMPQVLHSLPSFKHKTSRPRPPFSVTPEKVELLDTTDFIPLSQIKSEPLIVDYTPTDRQGPILKNTPPTESDISQISTYIPPPSKYKQLQPTLQTSRYNNLIPKPSQVYLSPEEYKDLIQSPTISKGSSSSSTNYPTYTNTDPQLTTSPMTVGTRPVPLYTSPISLRPENWPQSPNLAKFLPLHEIPVEVTPEKENIPNLLNIFRPCNKIPPLGVNNHPYELLPSIPEVPLKLDTVKPISIRKSGPNTDYEVIDTNELNECDIEIMSENIDLRAKKPDGIDAKSFVEGFPEIIEELSVPTYNNIAQRPQRLSKLDHFYANNHIGKSPQIFTVPSYKTLPVAPPTDVESPNSISTQIFKDFANLYTKNSGSVLKLDTLRPNEYYPEIANSEYVPTMNSYQNYLNPHLKTHPQRKLPTNAIGIANTSEMPYQPISYTPYNNIEDIKYAGYKTYQMPSSKSPKLTKNIGTPSKEYYPTVGTYSSPINYVKSSNVQQIPNCPIFYTPTEISEPHYSQYQTPTDMTTPLLTKLGLNNLLESPELNEYEPLIPHYLRPIELTTPLKTDLYLNSLQESAAFEEYGSLIPQHQTPADMATPLQTKLGLDTLEDSLEFDDYNPIEDLSVYTDNNNEDNELKSSLINYINKREDVKNNLYKKNTEFIIPIGNIAITKKQPYNANTIETNNPSIGLKVWKSNVKIAQAELKLKFKDLSVNNFMPVINNLDKYDMEEIRKIVKNYIDDKYGAHIEVNEPYTIDNKYTIIKDFDHNTVDNKFNLLWPTNYV